MNTVYIHVKNEHKNNIHVISMIIYKYKVCCTLLYCNTLFMVAKLKEVQYPIHDGFLEDNYRVPIADSCRTRCLHCWVVFQVLSVTSQPLQQTWPRCRTRDTWPVSWYRMARFSWGNQFFWWQPSYESCFWEWDCILWPRKPFLLSYFYLPAGSYIT